jgi:hypothetical protein
MSRAVFELVVCAGCGRKVAVRVKGKTTTCKKP